MIINFDNAEGVKRSYFMQFEKVFYFKMVSIMNWVNEMPCNSIGNKN